MGDPKRIRKKYETPSHPWIKSRIDEEKRLSREFGTKNKKELWKMETVLKKFKSQAKKLIALKTAQADVERDHLFRKVKELGLVSGDITYDSILSLTTDDLLARRLQSVIVSKGLARSVKQARQFITHEHILVGDKVITSPSYLVSIKDETVVAFNASSPYFREDHPERAIPESNKEAKAEAETLSRKSAGASKDEQPKEVKESTKKAPVKKATPKAKPAKEEAKTEVKKEAKKESPKAEEAKEEKAEAKEAPAKEAQSDKVASAQGGEAK